MYARRRADNYEMDPFTEVLQDAEQQQANLSQLLAQNSFTDESKHDFDSKLLELQETIEDLKESIESSKADPEFFKITPETIKEREDIVGNLSSQYDKLSSQWNELGSSKSLTPFKRFEGDAGGDHEAGTQNSDGVDTDTARFNAMQQQQMLREQDEHLDGVYASMQTIQHQARAMGTELEEQAFIMEDLEGELDRIGSKVGRGLKRVDHFIRSNQETASDCCIGLLIVALIVLLVLVVVV